MTILGVQVVDLRDVDPLGMRAGRALSSFRAENQNHHIMPVLAEVGFVLNSIVSAVETLAAAIAHLVVSGVHFFFPNDTVRQHLFEPIRNYAVKSFLVTQAVFLSCRTTQAVFIRIFPDWNCGPFNVQYSNVRRHWTQPIVRRPV